MKYGLIDKVKKFERTKRWIKSILVNQEESVNTMLDVIKSDGQNKLPTSRTPNLEEWKRVYTNMGWKYVEDRQVCICPTSHSFKEPISKYTKMFDDIDKKSFHQTSHYDEVVGNYETYTYCQQQVRQTQLILERLNSDYFNDQLLDYDHINHDEALCFLLGINVNLPNTLTLKNEKLLSVFDYESDPYDVSINGLLFHSKEHQLLTRKFGTSTIDTKEFIDWAIGKNYIKLIHARPTHAKTISKNNNLAKVKKALVEYLPKVDGHTNTYNLSTNQDFHRILGNKELSVEESGMNANEINSKKGDSITPTTLGDYIKEILKSNWWKSNPETSKIRKKIRKPIKNKSKK